jgi:glycosyltransferase 2 family protein
VTRLNNLTDVLRILFVTKRITNLALKVILTVGLSWLLIVGIDLGAASNRVKSIDLLMLGTAIILAFLQVGIASERWRVVMQAIGLTLSFKRTFQIQYIAQFFNQATPYGFGGDILRIWKARNQGLSTISALNSVVLDGAISLLALALVILGAQTLITERISSPGPALAVSLFVIGGISGAFVLLAILDRYTDQIKFPEPLKVITADANALFLRPRLGGVALAWAILQHFNISVMLFVLAVGLDINVSLLDCITLGSFMLLVMALPGLMPGWGAKEGAMAVVLVTVGVPMESALVLSIIFGLVNLFVALPGGIVWLLTMDVENSEINETANPWLMGLHLFFGVTLLTALQKSQAIPELGAIPSLVVIGVAYYLSTKFIGFIWQSVDAKGARIAYGLLSIPAYMIFAWGLAWVISNIT